jgi:hypothetical protein
MKYALIYVKNGKPVETWDREDFYDSHDEAVAALIERLPYQDRPYLQSREQALDDSPAVAIEEWLNTIIDRSYQWHVYEPDNMLGTWHNSEQDAKDHLYGLASRAAYHNGYTAYIDEVEA